MESSSTFETDGDFCPDCGTILKLDHIATDARCVVCHKKISLENLIGVTYNYNIDFTPLNYHSQAKKKNKKTEKVKVNNECLGQMDTERECSKCGHKGMNYTTMQLRSADEGQTIFYFCPHCRHRECEES